MVKQPVGWIPWGHIFSDDLFTNIFQEKNIHEKINHKYFKQLENIVEQIIKNISQNIVLDSFL